MVVLFLAFGMAAISGSTHASDDFEFSNTLMIGLVVQQVLIASVCVAILYLRGWKFWKNFPFNWNLKHGALSVGLYAASIVGYVILYNIAVLAVGLDALRSPRLTVTANVGLVVLVSLVNPMFEEMFVVYYLYERLKKYGPLLFISASAVLRVSYHLYQGWLGVISLLPFGVLCALAFWKTRNLMPLYVAHVIGDLLGLLAAPDH